MTTTEQSNYNVAWIKTSMQKPTNKLYNSMFECITAKHVEKRYREELSEPPMCLKIAYFKVLKDSEIVSELHRSSE